MDEKKQVWSTADIIKNRNNWTLASDVELLKHIQSLSEKLVSRTRSTLQLLNAFEDDVNSTCTSVANVNNRFQALSDTQFIENKVRDDSPETEESPALPTLKETENSENTTKKLNEALSNGIQVLRTQYDIIAVTDSESEDDEPPEVLLKARNPFMSRRLPYVIGSEEFNKHDHLGLVTSSEDEDDDNDSEVDEEDDDEDDLYYVKKVVPPPESIDIGFKARTQVIRVSSDSEDSDVSSSRSAEVVQNPVHSRAPVEAPRNSQNFADHLNATLRSMGSNIVTPLVDDVFSPPPLPSNADDRSSDEEKSDDGSDIFAARTKVSERSTKPDTVPDIFDDEVPTHVESSPISRKVSTTTDVSQPTSKSAHPVADSETRTTSKPYTSAPTSKMFSAVNAELSNRFHKNVPAKNESDSSDELESKSSSSSSNRKKPIAAQKLDEASQSRIQPTTSKDVPRPSKAHTEDIFESTSAKPAPKTTAAPKSRPDSTKQLSNTSKLNASKTKSKVISLFDDDDSMDDLFSSKEKEQKIASPPSTTGGHKVLFNDPVDLFSSVKEPDKLSIKNTTSSVASKKIDLFEDDSDSGDDIFAIINSQKKKSTANVAKGDVVKKPAPVENEYDLFASNEPKAPSKPSAKIDIFDTKNIAYEKSSQKLPSARKGTDLFDTDDESDIFSISSKSKEVSQSGEKSSEIEQDNSKSRTAESDGTKTGSLFEPKKVAPVPPSEPNEPSPSLFLENDVMKSNSSTKTISPDQKDDKSGVEDKVSKITHRPGPIPRSKIPENLGEVKADVPSSRISNDQLSESEPDQSTSEDKSSKSANKPSVLPRSKGSDETDLFTSSSLETTVLHDSTKSVRFSQPANVPEAAPTPSTPSKVPDETVDGSQASTIKPPAKLAINRGLNINVNALLPGSSWSSISKQVKGSTEETQAGEPVVVAATSPAVTQFVREAEPPKSVEKTPDSLTTIAKERTKLKGRRRPPSRQARVNKALQSDVFASNSSAADSADEEPDSAYKTASESNSPESNTSTEKTMANNLEENKHSIPSFDETEFVPPTSAITNYQKERSKLAKFARKRPPNMSKEKTIVDSPVAETETKNRTANDLGDILITASRSREPPAMIETDFKSALTDSDKEDDLLDDVLAEREIITDPLPEIDAISHLILSPPVAVPRTSASFNSFADDSTDDLFASLRSPSSQSSSLGGSAVTSPSVVDRPPAHPEVPVPKTQIVKDSVANASSKVGVKSTSDLFSFNEDDSDDDLETLFSKVAPAKVSATKSTGIPATKEIVADLKKESVVVPARVPATKSMGISASKEATVDLKKEPEISSATVREANVSEPPKKLDLFAESDSVSGAATSAKLAVTQGRVGSISTRSKEEAMKSTKTAAKISADLFADDDDDDELFSSKKRSSAKAKTPVSKNLFADDDDDDDDSLFGSAVPSQRGDKSTEILKAVSTTSTEKARIVKLRSQTVEKDPLTGEILK